MDQDVRELERAWAAGDTDAAAGLVRHRLRIGELSEDRLKLAASIGHPIARQFDSAPPLELAAWAKSMKKADPEVRARVAFAVVWSLAPRWLLRKDYFEVHRLRQTLDALAACVPTASKAHVSHLDQCLRAHHESTTNQFFHGVLPTASKIITRKAKSLPKVVASGAKLATNRVLARCIARDVGDWALGLRDPVAVREDPVETLRSSRPYFERPDADLMSLRFRAGDLIPRALEVLAHLRHPVALELGAEEGDPDLRQLLELLPTENKRAADGGRTGLVQLAVTLAEDRRSDWERRNPDDSIYGEGLAALHTWLGEENLKHLQAVQRVLGPASERDEPPWALYRAGMAVWAKDLVAAKRATFGALRWTLADRRVEALAESGSYPLKRKVERDRLDKLDPDLRARLNLNDSETIFSGPGQEALRDALRMSFSPVVLRSVSAGLKEVPSWPEPVAPVPHNPYTEYWEDHQKLSHQGAVKKLVKESRDRIIDRDDLRLAAFLGYQAAAEALGTLLSRAHEPAKSPEDWCRTVWKRSQRSWIRTVLLAIQQDGAESPLIDELLEGFRSDSIRAQECLHQLETDLSGRHSTAIRSTLTRRRGKAFKEAAAWIGAPEVREPIAKAMVPWVLGFSLDPKPEQAPR